MTKSQDFVVSRRGALKGGGALVVSLGVPATLTSGLIAEANASTVLARPLSPSVLDTYLAIAADESMTAYFGKMDMGQGLDVAIGQIVAEELEHHPS